MKFKFRLQTVLNVRQRNEDLAKTEFQLAQSQVDDCLFTIQKMYDQIGYTRSFVHTHENSHEHGQVANLQISHDFIEGQKVKIERERLRARELIQVAEQKMEVLKLAMQERKAIERLKEKKFEEFKKQKKKKEQEFFGELSILRSGRKSG